MIEQNKAGLSSGKPFSIVVLISGSGSNLQALIDVIQTQSLNATITAVISNVENAYGLVRAEQQGIATEVLAHGSFTSRADFDQALRQRIDCYQPDLVVLAGFMRLLTPEFVQTYHQRMINIHPSLLPKYRGLNTHQRAIEAGDTVHGASVHLVTAELDSGTVILQGEVAIAPDDTSEQLAKRVLTIEHVIYPQVVQWFIEGKLSFIGQQLCFEQKPLNDPIFYKAGQLHFPTS